jgi:hypothetical protein
MTVTISDDNGCITFETDRFSLKKNTHGKWIISASLDLESAVEVDLNGRVLSTDNSEARQMTPEFKAFYDSLPWEWPEDTKRRKARTPPN